MAESPEETAKKGPNTPTIAGFKDPDSCATFFVFVEQKILCRVSSFTSALMLWFAIHYVFHLQYSKDTSEVALFIQEFVLGLPSTTCKKTAAYLTVTSDIQAFSIN